MIDFTPGEEFLVAVQHEYRQGEPIRVDTSRGPLAGTVVAQISKRDYLEVWEFRGCDADGLSAHPRFYYRCAKNPASDEPLRGDHESA